MKKSTERLAFMRSQLDQLQLPFEVQEGIDGKTFDFSDVYDEQLSQKLNGAPLAKVEQGCAMSHWLILKRIVDESIPYTLVLEDDVQFSGQFKRALEQELEKHKLGLSRWEYLAFNYPSVGLKFIKLWIFLLSEQFRKNPSIKLYLKSPFYLLKFFGIVTLSFYEGVRNWLYAKLYPVGVPGKFYRPMYLAGCYLVTQEGAKKLLRIQHKIIYPADRIQNIARIKENLRLFWFIPLLVKQRRDKFESTMYQNKDYVFEKYD